MMSNRRSTHRLGERFCLVEQDKISLNFFVVHDNIGFLECVVFLFTSLVIDVALLDHFPVSCWLFPYLLPAFYLFRRLLPNFCRFLLYNVAQIDRRTLLENLALVLLAVDELVDAGRILEIDPSAIANRVLMRGADARTSQASELTVQQVRNLVRPTT